MTPMIECHCGATLAPAVIVRDDIGDRHRCPECRRYWECCPCCFAWSLPFATRNTFQGCPSCGLRGEHKSALRLPADEPRSRTLRDLREDPATPWQSLDGTDTTPTQEYDDDGEVSV